MKNLQKVARNPLLWVVLALVFVIGVVQLANQASAAQKVPTSQALSVLNGSEPLSKVTMNQAEQSIRIVTKDGKKNYQST